MTRDTATSNGDVEASEPLIDRVTRQASPWSCCCTRDNRYPLYHYQQLPLFLRGNPYVVHGYRVQLPCRLCLKSLFYWSNETVNVWSHLIGFFVFLYLMIADNLVLLPALNASLSDRVVISVALVCYQICMLSSAGYHLFCCHSESAARRWFAIDLAGISVGLIGCYLPGIYYAFYCFALWRNIYVLLLSVLFANVLYWQTRPHYYTERWFHVRWLLYCGLSAFGLFPSVHWAFLNSGTDIFTLFLQRVVVMYSLIIVAFCFYISKWPERSCPGTFDYIGCSHQWWHIIVLVAFYWWHSSGIELMLYHQKNMCHA